MQDWTAAEKRWTAAGIDCIQTDKKRRKTRRRKEEKDWIKKPEALLNFVLGGLRAAGGARVAAAIRAAVLLLYTAIIPKYRVGYTDIENLCFMLDNLNIIIIIMIHLDYIYFVLCTLY